MHRIGGIEKEDGSGNISYDPANHARMVALRAERVARIADDIAPAEVLGDVDADLCVIGWGSTWGAITSAVGRVRSQGKKVAQVHLTHLNPFPANLGEVLDAYSTVLVPRNEPRAAVPAVESRVPRRRPNPSPRSWASRSRPAN